MKYIDYITAMDNGNVINVRSLQEVAVTKGVARVCSLLLTLKCADSPQGRLPATVDLCRQFSCSPQTLRKAVQLLVSQGVATAIPGGGVFWGKIESGSAVVEACAAPVLPPRVQSRWEIVRNNLLHLVASGKLAPKEKLPSVKELALRYETSYRTVCAALSDLVRTGQLVRAGRGFRVFQTSPSSSSATIVLICATDIVGILSSLTPRTRELWQTLEKECGRLDLTLVVRSIADIHNNVLVSTETSVFGYLIMSLFMTHKDIGAAVAHLSQSNKPISVLDETGVCEGLGVLYRNARIRVFTLGVGSVSGRIAGEYLLNRGHRRIAYLSLIPHDQSNLLRQEGVCQAFAAAGIRDGVRCFSLEQFATSQDMYNQLKNTSFIKKALSLVDCAWQELTEGMNVSYVPFVPSRFDEIGHIAFMNRQFPPLFEQALADPTITAWVAYNDLLAFVALNYLEKNRIRVPTDISLIGFDDTVEAFGNGLTSYYFNTPGTVRGMLDHLIKYHDSRQKCASGPIELPGYVMSRRTVRSLNGLARC